MLHRTNTNIGDATGGSTWGFEGDNLFILIGTLLPSLAAAVYCWQNGFGWIIITLAGSLLPTGAIIYIFGFKQGKPQAFDSDFVETLLKGIGWSRPEKFPNHPLYVESTSMLDA